jgi:hypothetical protein
VIPTKVHGVFKPGPDRHLDVGVMRSRIWAHLLRLVTKSLSDRFLEEES